VRICYAARMPWTDEFWRPIRRKAGPTLTTLGEAREFILTLPAIRQAAAHWQEAEELLGRAAIAPSAQDAALTAVVRALMIEGLL
jgi:hypothetical protein